MGSLSCTLTPTDLNTRLDALRELGEALVAVDADGDRATLRFGGDRGAIERFVAEESRCCPFFAFEISGADPVTLAIGVPDGGEPMLRSLVAAFVAGWRAGL